MNMEILLRFSSFNKMKRTIAYCLRFASNCRAQRRFPKYLDTEEYKEAEKRIIKLIQHINFGNELQRLKTNLPLDKKNKLLSLNPFVDSGLVRVGDRLKHADLEFNQKHPILLPCSNHVTELIREVHIKLYHAGSQTTLYAIRQSYWIINGKTVSEE